MKKIILIVIGVICFLGLTFGVIVLATTSEANKSQEEKNYSYSEYLENMNIEIDLESTETTISKSTDNKIYVNVIEYSNVTYDVSLTDSTLKVKENYVWELFNFSFKRKVVEIKLPEVQINNFVINSTSGNVSVEGDFKINYLNYNCTSGAGKIEDVTVNNLEAEGTSGSIEFDDITVTDMFEVNVNSGKISVTDSILNKCDLHTISGEHKIENSEMKEVKCRSTSGKITLDFVNTDISSIDCSATSGSINIHLLKDIKGYKVLYNIGSGKFRSTFGDNNPNYQGDGSITINAETTSGNINIYKK